MKYLLYILCSALALLAGLAMQRHFAFIPPFTSWPLALTMIAAASLIFARRTRYILAAAFVLVAASILQLIGAFFTLICALYHAVSTGDTLNPVLDLLILSTIATASLLLATFITSHRICRALRSAPPSPTA